MSAPQLINSAIVRAPERAVLRGGRWHSVDVGVRYGLLLHPIQGPVLIDTGYGPRATEGASRSLALKAYGALLRPRLVAEGQPAAALAKYGLTLADVRLAVVTHFHPDHIAGLRDLPNARFLASGEAWQAVRRMGRLAELRHAVFPELLPDDFGERLIPIESLPPKAAPYGLGTGIDLFGDGSALAVPLPGHALGHFGIVWPDLSPPLLHAVDASWLSAAIVEDRLPRGPARLVYADALHMAHSAARIRAFARSGGAIVTCHDRVAP